MRPCWLVYRSCFPYSRSTPPIFRMPNPQTSFVAIVLAIDVFTIIIVSLMHRHRRHPALCKRSRSFIHSDRCAPLQARTTSSHFHRHGDFINPPCPYNSFPPNMTKVSVALLTWALPSRRTQYTRRDSYDHFILSSGPCLPRRAPSPLSVTLFATSTPILQSYSTCPVLASSLFVLSASFPTVS